MTERGAGFTQSERGTTADRVADRPLPEFFVVTNSFAAPFFSDTDEHWVRAKSATAAIAAIRKNYGHPCGLYAAVCWRDANAHSKGEAPLARWDSPKAKKDWGK